MLRFSFLPYNCLTFLKMPPMNKCVLSALCFLYFSNFAWTQETFQFTTAKKKQRLTFELINNLIVIPVRVNGVELSFLLDSGVNSTLLFNNSNVNQLHFEDKQLFRSPDLVGTIPLRLTLRRGIPFKLKTLLQPQSPFFCWRRTILSFQNGWEHRLTE